MPEIKIGYSSQNYPEIRNIIDKTPNASYMLTRDYYSISRSLKQKLGVKNWHSLESEFQFNDLGLNRVDLFHFFNSVSYTARPWISSFESFIPRFKYSPQRINHPERVLEDRNIQKAIRALASDSCKQLIAISDCTARLQNSLLDLFPEFSGAIQQKMITLMPPQSYLEPPLINEMQRNRSASTDIRFTLIGHQFFSKGGREILAALNKLRTHSSKNIRLTIVSNLKTDAYASATNLTDAEDAKAFITDNSHWIDYYSSLPNHDVLKIMADTHIGLLPSYAETFGYSVLEFQAFGVPVITTDIRAFPQINNDKCGWLISIPKQASGEASLADKQALSNSVYEGLISALTEIFNTPETIAQKGKNSYDRIVNCHCPEKYSKHIDAVYAQALSTGFSKN